MILHVIIKFAPCGKEEKLRTFKLQTGEEVPSGTLFYYLKRLVDFAEQNHLVLLSKLHEVGTGKEDTEFSEAETKILNKENFLVDPHTLHKHALIVIRASLTVSQNGEIRLINPCPNGSEGAAEAGLALRG